MKGKKKKNTGNVTVAWKEATAIGIEAGEDQNRGHVGDTHHSGTVQLQTRVFGLIKD